jgi:hypothetical protein
MSPVVERVEGISVVIVLELVVKQGHHVAASFLARIEQCSVTSSRLNFSVSFVIKSYFINKL